MPKNHMLQPRSCQPRLAGSTDVRGIIVQGAVEWPQYVRFGPRLPELDYQDGGSENVYT